jgi:hypothetical protein
MRGSVVGTAVTLAAGALLTAAMTTASAGTPAGAAATAAQAASPKPVLVDCMWHRNVRPTDFILACGDGNSVLTKLDWKQWNAWTATAEGVNLVNDCKPYCAAGKFHPYPVTVRLDRPAPWKKNPGVEHFTRMSLTYTTEARPEGFKQVMVYPLWD